jgi:glycogen phosphorylase
MTNQDTLPTPSPLVAYFCMEFALDNEYGIYSGGLGVLAGDLLNQANDNNANLVGVGLAYASTYNQTIADDGRQLENNITIDPVANGLTKIMDKDDEPIEVVVPINNRLVRVRAWSKKIGNINLVLLDTNVQENSSADQHILNQLYSGDQEHRLLQEIILGIGGVRILHAMGLNVDIYHMNEGHSALLSLELAHQYRKHDKAISINSALAKAKQKIVFTNHTLVAAGRDLFSFELVSTYLLQYAQEIEIPVDEIIKMGKLEATSLFSMNMMALRNASRSSAVSQYHAKKAQEIWHNHPLIPITNGVYFPRWLSSHVAPLVQAGLSEQSGKDLWIAHQQDKTELIEYVKETTQKVIPQEALIFSWARRFVTYKRPLALFWQLDRLEKIIQESPIPLHFIYGGKLHPQNNEGKDLMAQVVRLSRSDRFRDHITFIPNYNLQVAKHLVRGSDVWLNTPIVGYEACGTSGMKAALNGILQCSTNDGWVKEIDWDQTGWILDSEHISESLYDTIEQEIIPLYAKREHDYPVQWAEMMVKSSNIIQNNYSMSRMLKDYCVQLYGMSAD